jgi:hypothetical protein
MKKAQSISINTIVVAAIALIVMILIVMIFTGNITKWRRSADSCQSNGGSCIDKDNIDTDCSGDYNQVRREYTCFKGTEVDNEKVCCVKI